MRRGSLGEMERALRSASSSSTGRVVRVKVAPPSADMNSPSRVRAPRVLGGAEARSKMVRLPWRPGKRSLAPLPPAPRPSRVDGRRPTSPGQPAPRLSPHVDGNAPPAPPPLPAAAGSPPLYSCQRGTGAAGTGATLTANDESRSPGRRHFSANEESRCAQRRKLSTNEESRSAEWRQLSAN